jgi:Ca-activated chloride channel family protein
VTTPHQLCSLRRCLLVVGILLILCAPAALPARAQEPPADTYALRVDVRLVNVDVAVTDTGGHFVDHLTRDNFELYENGVRQDITHFAPTRAPVRVVLLVEMSPAVFLIKRDHLLAAYALLRALRPEDEVALVSYARDTRSLVPFTRDKSLVEERLNLLGGFGLGMAEMNLLDAVGDTLDWLTPVPHRTAILVIGTGLDSGSKTSWQDLQQRLGASQVTVFTLATGFLLRGEPEEGKNHRAAARATQDLEAVFADANARLRALAEASAGEAYFPESARELSAIYEAIGERLRNLYSLGYDPTNTARDGSYRQISVRLVDEHGLELTRDAEGRPASLRVFARPGYFAPRD